MDVVIDETPVMNPVEYTMSTFLDNIRGQDRDEPCFEFITNKSIWRYDKLVANNTKVLGKKLSLLFYICELIKSF